LTPYTLDLGFDNTNMFYWPRSKIQKKNVVINIHESITEIAVTQRVPLVEQELYLSGAHESTHGF